MLAQGTVDVAKLYSVCLDDTGDVLGCGMLRARLVLVLIATLQYPLSHHVILRLHRQAACGLQLLVLVNARITKDSSKTTSSHGHIPTHSLIFAICYRQCHNFSLSLQHNNTHAAHLARVDVVPLVDTSWQRRRPPVEEVEMQFAITRLEFLLF